MKRFWLRCSTPKNHATSKRWRLSPSASWRRSLSKTRKSWRKPFASASASSAMKGALAASHCQSASSTLAITTRMSMHRAKPLVIQVAEAQCEPQARACDWTRRRFHSRAAWQRGQATRASNAGSDRHRSNCMLAAAGKATLPTARRRDLRTCVSWCSYRQRCRHTWS